jgi:calcium-dependent protein kinase
LKPENFLLLTKDPIERNVLKIIDFGVSCTFEAGEQLRDKAGTPFYTSPQVLEGRYTEACDAWSCGVIMYMMLCGVPPFPGKTDTEVWGKVKRGNFAFQPEPFKKVSEETKNLIRDLLKYQERQRITPQEALNHEAIQLRAPRGKDVKLRNTIIGSLRNFAFSTKLKKAALTAVAQTSREDHMAGLRETFLALDSDDDGFVTFNELHSALESAGLTPPSDLEVIVDEVDGDGSGAINYIEFLAATLEETFYLKKDHAWAAFLVFDRDGDGKISKEELQLTLGDPDVGKALSNGSWTGTPQAIADLLKESDLDGDGASNFSEVRQMLKKGCTNGSSNGHRKEKIPNGARGASSPPKGK